MGLDIELKSNPRFSPRKIRYKDGNNVGEARDLNPEEVEEIQDLILKELVSKSQRNKYEIFDNYSEDDKTWKPEWDHLEFKINKNGENIETDPKFRVGRTGPGFWNNFWRQRDQNDFADWYFNNDLLGAIIGKLQRKYKGEEGVELAQLLDAHHKDFYFPDRYQKAKPREPKPKRKTRAKTERLRPTYDT
jgi:hypothetical protein